MGPQIGELVKQRYRVLRLIGDGGMGTVYEARHELLGTTVALKFLHPHLMRREGLKQRFLQEAQLSARIKSPHVVRASDVDESERGLAYFVMEYVQGGTLEAHYKELHAQQRWLSRDDAFDHFLQILEGVEAAHSLGIVHRDLKPDNVMMARDDDGRVLLKILDFGVAKLKASDAADRGLTAPGAVMGTPEYMAPEQAFSPKHVDGRADIFALGVMFYEMLSGRRPVEGGTLVSIADAYFKGNVTPLAQVASVDERLAAAVHQAIAPQPEQRFADAAAFRDAIAAVSAASSLAPKALPKSFATTVDDHHAPVSAPVSAQPWTQPLPPPVARTVKNEPPPVARTVKSEPPPAWTASQLPHATTLESETRRLGADTFVDGVASARDTRLSDPPVVRTLPSQPPPAARQSAPPPARTVWSEPPPPMTPQPPPVEPWSQRPSSLPTVNEPHGSHTVMVLAIVIVVLLAVAGAAVAYAWSAGVFGGRRASAQSPAMVPLTSPS